MKKKILVGTAIIALVLVSFVGGSTFAKYIFEYNTSASLEIAKWSVNENFLVNGQSISSDRINLAKTYNTSTLVNGKIAPGTSGEFQIIVDGTGTETGINYEIKFDNIQGNKPSNMLFHYNGRVYDTLETLSKDLRGNIPADAENKTLNLEIGWSWAYETLFEEKIQDIQDTLDGQNISNYSFDVTIICTQDIPKE